jgi:hypothetical protein
VLTRHKRLPDQPNLRSQTASSLAWAAQVVLRAYLALFQSVGSSHHTRGWTQMTESVQKALVAGSATISDSTARLEVGLFSGSHQILNVTGFPGRRDCLSSVAVAPPKNLKTHLLAWLHRRRLSSPASLEPRVPWTRRHPSSYDNLHGVTVYTLTVSATC